MTDTERGFYPGNGLGASDPDADLGPDGGWSRRGGTPAQFLDRLSGTLRSTSTMAAGVASTARDNPIPFALIGAGLAWMTFTAMQAGRSESAVSSHHYPSYPGGDEQAPSWSGSETGQWVRAGRRQVGRLQEAGGRVLHEQPLVLGALGIAAGAVLGALLPMSRRENAVLGPSRDELLSRAAAAGRQRLRETAEAAEAAVEAGTGEFEERMRS